jgi:hypothetical protein
MNYIAIYLDDPHHDSSLLFITFTTFSFIRDQGRERHVDSFIHSLIVIFHQSHQGYKIRLTGIEPVTVAI